MKKRPLPTKANIADQEAEPFYSPEEVAQMEAENREREWREKLALKLGNDRAVAMAESGDTSTAFALMDKYGVNSLAEAMYKDSLAKINEDPERYRNDAG